MATHPDGHEARGGALRRRRRRPMGALGTAAAALLAIGGAAGAAGLVQAAGAATGSTTALTTLSEDILPGLPLLTATPAATGTVLHIGVAISAPDPAGEAALEQAIYDPSSPQFHQFLTPSAFDARFGVAPATVSSVESWLRSGGLQVTLAGASGTWIQATGTVGQIESLMNVRMASYESKGTSFLANENAPSVPAGDSISTVVGLNTLQKFSIPKTVVGQTSVPSGPGCLPSCDYVPQDLWSMYDEPASDEGQGETMAVFGEGQTADVISNLRAFEGAMKLPQVPITVHDVGAGPFTDDSGQVEWDLDTQSSTGMAPDVLGETLYFASSLTDADVETVFTDWVGDPNGPTQANASFGECETDPGNEVWNAVPPEVGQFVGDGDNLEPVAEGTLEQATLEGRTLFAAAGDTGSSCPLAALPVIGAGNGVLNQGQPMLNYPCASDYAVCVGGTVLYSDGNTPPSRNLEYAWPYTGGGSSLFQQEPSWQAGVSAVDHPCVVDPSGSPYPSGTTCRGAPDVAAMSGDIATNAYDFYENGSASTEGGTSLSSPLWVGMWTRVQAAAKSASGLGFADPTFYAIGAGKEGDYTKDFFDVTIGTNGLYQAGTGWDYVSGWGVPDVTNLTQDLDGTLTPRDDVLPPPPTPAAATLACGLLWQNGPHTATDLVGNSDPQLTLDSGTMTVKNGGADLAVQMHIADLSTTMPTGATGEDWYTTWTWNGTTYFASAQLEATPTATVTYSDGTENTTGGEHSYSAANTDTGSFTPGTDGVVEIDVPLANIGGLKAGDVISNPASETYTEEGAPGAASLLETVDSGGPTVNYAIGQPTVCMTQSHSSVVYGQENADRFTATLTAPAGEAAPSGTVTVASGSGSTRTVLCTISSYTDSSNVATGSCTPAGTAFPAGAAFSSITADYGGSTAYPATSSTPYLAFSVSKATSKTLLALSATSIQYGRERSVRFAVAVGVAGVVPSGTVSVITGRTLICRVTLVHGEGYCSPATGTLLRPGNYAVTATWAGNGDVIGSTSAVRALRVT